MSGEGEGGIVNFLRGGGVWIFSGTTQYGVVWSIFCHASDFEQQLVVREKNVL